MVTFGKTKSCASGSGHFGKRTSVRIPLRNRQHIRAPRGTYARSVAHSLGEHLDVPALALHILRTKVGEYTVEKSIK